jgi:hypothetical protein
MSVNAVLSVQSIIDEAVAITGQDDFGSADWSEGLEVLVTAARTEAKLNEAGEMSFRYRMLNCVTNRLQVIDWIKNHPEIKNEKIERPLMIIGLPRTGTTALSNLLAADSDTRSLRVWESGSLIPPPTRATYESDERIATAQAGLDLLIQMVPTFPSMYDDSATGTAEAIDLLGMSFRAFQLTGMAVMPSFDQWWLNCDMDEAYALHRQTLQLLQAACPPRRWHLKNPSDVFYLEAVRKTYPDAIFVWTHRDPAQVIPSVTNLIAELMDPFVTELDRPQLGRTQIALWAKGIERAQAFRADNPEGFIDVAMADLAADPLGTAARVYEAADWKFTNKSEVSMKQHLADTPRRGHKPDLDQYNFSLADIRNQFSSYCDQFSDFIN